MHGAPGLGVLDRFRDNDTGSIRQKRKEEGTHNTQDYNLTRLHPPCPTGHAPQGEERVRSSCQDFNELLPAVRCWIKQESSGCRSDVKVHFALRPGTDEIDALLSTTSGQQLSQWRFWARRDTFLGSPALNSIHILMGSGSGEQG
jgi:hypothetical protein